MVHNDVRFAKIIHTVQIELEIDLIGEYYVYFCWIDMCLYGLTFSFCGRYLKIKKYKKYCLEIF